jgi:hypothetical protein
MRNLAPSHRCSYSSFDVQGRPKGGTLMHRGLVLISAIALSTLLIAAKAVPPSSLEGYWKGSGTISAKSGTDRVLCRVRCKRSGGTSFSFSATCTTEAGRYELSGHVTSAGGGRYTGTVLGGEGGEGSGRVHLIQRGKHLSVTASGHGGSAKLTLSKL